MGRKKTPLLQKLRQDGATLYVFPSASEDIDLNINNDAHGVALSHYALLNIPQIGTGTNQFNIYKDGAQMSPEEKIASSLQNYMMNYETRLINDERYNYQQTKTVTEKVFWQWMQHVGLCNITYDNNIGAWKESGVLGQRLVQCFGAIDAGNSLSTEFGMFNETYINIPSSYGCGPTYFTTDNNDMNMRPNTTYTTTSASATSLEGRDEHISWSYLNEATPFFDEGTSYKTGSNCFQLMKNVSDISNAIYKDYNISEIDRINFDSFDAINIDQHNKFHMPEEFEFNAILLYYSVYGQNEVIKVPHAINLFGIVFLDAPKTVNSIISIPTHIKRRTINTKTSSSFGNSFSFRINIKTMGVYDNTEQIINDNTTLSSIATNDFSDVISQLNRAIGHLNTNVQVTKEIKNQYNNIAGFYANQSQQIDDISTLINSYINGSKSSYINVANLYCNNIMPLPNNEDNDFAFYVKRGEDQYGQNTYGEPIMYISDSGISATAVNSIESTTGKSYVNLTGILNQQDTVITQTDTAVNAVLDDMFKNNKLVVKKRPDTDSYKNMYYIDPASDILVNEASLPQTVLKSVATKDGEDNSNIISYESLIPYMILQLQRLTATVESLKS